MREERRLVTRFGLLWDDNRNPHCPACRCLLSNRAYRNGSVLEVEPIRDARQGLIEYDTMICKKCGHYFTPEARAARPDKTGARPVRRLEKVNFDEARSLL